MNQHQQQPPPQPVAPVPAKEEPEYSAAATSSGTGFFGETNLLDKDPDAPPLPDDAEEVVERVRAYFDDILADENAVAAMTAAQAKGFQATSTKIVDALTELFAAQKNEPLRLRIAGGHFRERSKRGLRRRTQSDQGVLE